MYQTINQMRAKKAEERQNLLWYKDGLNNWGDYLPPYLYEKITGEPANDIIYHDKISKEPIVSIGSILDINQNPDSIIWGTGFMHSNSKCRVNPKQILAVRGPLTRDLLIQQGIACPKVYGDPALLISRFYYPSVEKKYLVGVIPHYVDVNHPFVTSLKNNRLIKIINVCQPIEDFIKDVLSCEKIISSSLHGIICADSYGIPNTWIKLSDKVGGKGFKFMDYFASIKKEHNNPEIFTGALSTAVNWIRPSKIDIDLDKLYEVCPFNNKKVFPKVAEPKTPKLISFYYDVDGNTFYSDCAKKLSKRCDELGIKYDFRNEGGGDSWIKNCRFKPTFILKMLNELNEDLAFIDIDSIILRKPTFEIENEWGVDWHYVGMKKVRPYDYIHYIKNTPKNKEFLKLWADLIDTNDNGDHTAFIKLHNLLDIVAIPHGYYKFGLAITSSKDNYYANCKNGDRP